MDTQNANVIEQDRLLIDRITYLATLTSESKAIDPILDPLREITARWNKSEPFSENDRMRLNRLESDLKEFLITKDPLRSFTTEELDDRVHMHEKTGTTIFGINQYVFAALVSFILGGLTYLLPIDLSIEYKNLIAAGTQMLTAQLITVWLYISNLDDFKQEFRRAFVYISIGILPLGGLFAQIALVQVLGIANEAPFRYAGLTYLAMFTFIIMYIGFRKYALLLQIKSKLTSWIWIAVFSVVAAAIVAVLPHSSHPPHELFFDISMSSMTVGVIYAGLSALLIGKIMRLVTTAYRKPLFILYIYMYAAVFGMSLAIVAEYFIGELRGDSLTIVILLAAIPQQLLLLGSGYLFKKYVGR